MAEIKKIAVIGAGQMGNGIAQVAAMSGIDVVMRDNLLPMGLAEGCKLKRDLPKDTIITYDDIELPEGRLCDELRAKQTEVFFG